MARLFYKTIKTKLFEFTKEFKGLIFLYCLWIKLTKNDEVFKNKSFADLAFGSKIKKNGNIIIEELLAIQPNQFSTTILVLIFSHFSNI